MHTHHDFRALAGSKPVGFRRPAPLVDLGCWRVSMHNHHDFRIFAGSKTLMFSGPAALFTACRLGLHRVSV